MHIMRNCVCTTCRFRLKFTNAEFELKIIFLIQLSVNYCAQLLYCLHAYLIGAKILGGETQENALRSQICVACSKIKVKIASFQPVKQNFRHIATFNLGIIKTFFYYQHAYLRGAEIARIKVKHCALGKVNCKNGIFRLKKKHKNATTNKTFDTLQDII